MSPGYLRYPHVHGDLLTFAAGDELVAVDGQPADPARGPWPLLAGTAGKPVELVVRTSSQPDPRRVVVVPLPARPGPES